MLIQHIKSIPSISRILLVDDHALVRSGMRNLILGMVPGIQVFEAAGFEEAMVCLEKTQMDLAMIDLNLGAGAGGLSLLSAIRAREWPMKVVIVSAQDDQATVMHCIEVGASGYIAKSTGDENVILAALDVVLRGGVYLPNSFLLTPPFKLQKSETSLDHAHLTPRLKEVLYYLCQGLSNKSIARKMNIAENTVRKSYVSDLLAIFGVTRRTELMIEISRRGIRIPEPTANK